MPHDCNKDYASLMKECWEKDPESRPDFRGILEKLKAILAGIVAVKPADSGSPGLAEDRE